MGIFMRFFVLFAAILLTVFSGCENQDVENGGDTDEVISAGLTITFDQFKDTGPAITGPTLYRVSNGGPTKATLILDNPGQYDGISWEVQDTNVIGYGPSFTLDAANSMYSLLAEHFLMVFVKKNGVPYNTTLSFLIEY